MDKLKKCPFCGGEAKLFYGAFETTSVKCELCGVETLMFNDSPNSSGKEKAIKAWNRRAESKGVEIDQVKNEPPKCYQPDGDGCAYQTYGDDNDEPIDKCKECPYCYSDKMRHISKPIETEGVNTATQLEVLRTEATAMADAECNKHESCGECPLFKHAGYDPCEEWVREHPEEAMIAIMGGDKNEMSYLRV